MENKQFLKKVSWVILFIFLFMNVVAFFHAYKFTHFAGSSLSKTKDPKQLTTLDKLEAAVFGVNNPRPIAKKIPTQDFQTIQIESNKMIACWWIKSENPKGTIVLFHGYSGEKSSLLERANVFRDLGYNTLLVDFMGSGGSEGDQTTIGFHEAEQVKSCYTYLKSQESHDIYLFGTSMGAVAILKAIHDDDIAPAGIIIECPFGSLYQTTCARFANMGLPCFPMAGLLVLWGGIQNGYWAFSHNPVSYAPSVRCSTLLLYGEQDDKVSREEIHAIYNNLSGPKVLKTYPSAGHDNYLEKYKQQWVWDVTAFLKEIQK